MREPMFIARMSHIYVTNRKPLFFKETIRCAFEGLRWFDDRTCLSKVGIYIFLPSRQKKQNPSGKQALSAINREKSPTVNSEEPGQDRGPGDLLAGRRRG